MSDDDMNDSDSTDAIATAREGTAAVGELIKAAGDSDEAKTAARNLGKTAVTITETVNNCLLPLAAVNFAVEKARQYFVNKFADDMAEKTKDIPSENIIEPKPSIAGPALQGLAFSLDEDELKNLYLTLLASAMDDRSADNAHPAYVEVLKQLTPEEAQILSLHLEEHSSYYMARIMLELEEGGTRVLQRYLLKLETGGEPYVIDNLSAMFDNFDRLGLLDLHFDRWSQREDAYDWVKERPEYMHFEALFEHEGEVTFEKGLVFPSSFGISFAKAVGIITPEE